MGKYFGQIMFNCAAAAAGAVIFTSTAIIESAPSAVLGIAVLIAVMCAVNYMFIIAAGKGRMTYRRDRIITAQTFDSLNQPESYIRIMKELRNYYPCRQEADRMVRQWELFRKKSATLKTISCAGGVYEVIDQDVGSVMLNNMELFMKRAAIMQSSDGTELQMHRNYLKTLTARNDKILGEYTNLLIEASQLTGENSDKAEIRSLKLLIESIRDFRNETEGGDKK